jgi:hypothetical protein
MDRPKPLNALAEDWLWSLPWEVGPECGWSAVIGCLRRAARVEAEHDCAEWADLIEALTSAPSADEARQPGERLAMKAECH